MGVRLSPTLLTPAQWGCHWPSPLLLTCHMRRLLAEVRWRLGGSHGLEGWRRVAGGSWVEVVGGWQKACAGQHPSVVPVRWIWRRSLVPLGRHCCLMGVVLLLLLLLLSLLLLLLLLLLTKLHTRMVAWCHRREGGGSRTNHSSWLERLQVACKEGRLQPSPRSSLDDAAVGRQLVVAPRAQKDGLASSRLVGGLSP